MKILVFLAVFMSVVYIPYKPDIVHDIIFDILFILNVIGLSYIILKHDKKRKTTCLKETP